jgi:cytochrome c-type biogenesis protein CcmH/NrfG
MPTAHPDLLLRARTAAAEGDHTAARQAYVTLLQRNPADVVALVELGAVAAASGYGAAALTAFRQAVAIDPTHPIALTGYANQIAADDPSQAIASTARPSGMIRTAPRRIKVSPAA